MQNMSDYYLAQRFAVQSKQITCSPIDGKIAESVVSERIDLKNSDFKWGLNHITSDRIDELIKDFKNNALAVDDASIEKHKVASRHILYKQLADAYAFGLVCFSSIHNKDHLDEILTKYKLTCHIKPLVSDGHYNKWNAITALLYGEWEQVSEDEADGLRYARDRSAEKYASVLYILDHQCVPTGKAADYIANYTYEDASGGKKLRGMVAMQKAYALGRKTAKNGTSQGRTQKQIDRRNKLIARGENPALNDDIFNISLPAELPEAFEYGRMVMKRVSDIEGNNKLLVVGYETWERSSYEDYAYARGRDAEQKEKEAQAKQDDCDKKASDDRSEIASNIGNDVGVSELLGLGFSKEQIVAALKAAVDGMKPHVATESSVATEHPTTA